MTKFNALLLVLLVVSCFWLVRVEHESRRLFNELDRTRTEARLLDNEFQRLRSDQQSQATPLRVEKTARERLAMRLATPAVTQYISRADAASQADPALASDLNPRAGQTGPAPAWGRTASSRSSP